MGIAVGGGQRGMARGLLYDLHGHTVVQAVAGAGMAEPVWGGRPAAP